jgi:hypothetical protein
VFHLESHMISCAGCSISVVLWRGTSAKPEEQFETKFTDFCQRTAKSTRKRLSRSRTSQRKTTSSSVSTKRSPPAELWRLIEERPLPESILVYVRLRPKKCRLIAFPLTQRYSTHEITRAESIEQYVNPTDSSLSLGRTEPSLLSSICHICSTISR